MVQEFERIQRINISDLLPNPYQPESRLAVKPERAKEFALSFQKSGMIQMPIVRHSRTVGGKYEIADGWQRRAGAEYAFRELGIVEYETIACVVKNLTDQEMADMILETSDIRVSMNVIERAEYYRKYFEKFPGVTQAEFASRHNRSQSEIANTMRLLELPEGIRAKIISQEITETHGRSLLQVKDIEMQAALTASVIADGWTVHRLDEEIRYYLDKLNPKMEITEAPKEEKTEAPATAKGEAGLQPSEAGENGTREEPVKDLEMVEEDDEEPEELVHPEKPVIEPEKTTIGLEKKEPEKVVHSAPAARQPEHKPEPAKAQAPKPVAQAPKTEPPAAAPEKPKWGRKLVIEELPDGIRMSMAKAGSFPEMWKMSGTFDEALDQVKGWAAALEEKWSKEEKK
jgi:ParB family chromosome partitioning protein